MRLRDKLFPEGSFLRKVLRSLAHIAKGFKPSNMKKVINSIKTNGWKKTLVQIKGIVFGKVEYNDFNADYKDWIKHNEPSPKELEEQRKVKFAYNPILV